MPCKKMMTFFLLLSLLLPVLLYSQEADPAGNKYIYLSEESQLRFGAPDPNTGMSHMYTEKVNKFRIGRNGNDKSVGFFGQHLRKVVASNPEAVAELDKYSQRKTGVVMTYVAFGAGALVAIATQEDTGERVFDPRTGQYEDKKKLTGAGIAGLVVSGVAVITGLALSAGSDQYIVKAVEYYNNGVRTQKENSAFKLRIAPARHFTGITLTLQL